MTCRTFTRPEKTADGRIRVHSFEQFENEEYHDFDNHKVHNMVRGESQTDPGWVDLTCTCGMRVTFAPDLAAEMYRDAEEDDSEGPSYIVLWDAPYSGNPDDIKTPIKCRFCPTMGYVHFAQEDLDELPQPIVFECVACATESNKRRDEIQTAD